MRQYRTDSPGQGPNSAAIAPALARLRAGTLRGEISGDHRFAEDLSLHVDPAMSVQGRVSSPSGRMFELALETSASGNWLAIHVRLAVKDLRDAVYFGMTARGTGPGEAVVRPCLRSGTADGFVDHFFARHILVAPETRDYVDALHIPTIADLPPQAPWRELVLFLPVAGLEWHLHDLRLFVV